MYSQLFSIQADLFKALAHSRRLEIVNLLREEELCVSDIYEMLDLPQANISQHLTILRDAGVVTTHREGKQIKYQLADAKISLACDTLKEFLIELNQQTELAEQLSLEMTELLPIVHDPVCQMRVSPKTAGASLVHDHQTYYFCASGCFKKFSTNPEKYVKN